SCERAQRMNVRLGFEESPQPLGSKPGEREFNMHGSAQTHHVLSCVGAADAAPPRIPMPNLFYLLCCKLLLFHFHDSSPPGGVHRNPLKSPCPPLDGIRVSCIKLTGPNRTSCPQRQNRRQPLQQADNSPRSRRDAERIPAVSPRLRGWSPV